MPFLCLTSSPCGRFSVAVVRFLPILSSQFPILSSLRVTFYVSYRLHQCGCTIGYSLPSSFVLFNIRHHLTPYGPAVPSCIVLNFIIIFDTIPALWAGCTFVYSLKSYANIQCHSSVSIQHSSSITILLGGMHFLLSVLASTNFCHLLISYLISNHPLILIFSYSVSHTTLY